MTLSLSVSLALTALVASEAFVGNTDNAFAVSRQQLFYQQGGMLPEHFEQGGHPFGEPFGDEMGMGMPPMGPPPPMGPEGFMGGQPQHHHSQGPPTAFREDFLQTADMKQPGGGSFRPVSNNHGMGMNGGGFEQHPPMGMGGGPFGQQFEDGLMTVGNTMQGGPSPFEGGPFGGPFEQGPPGPMFHQGGEFPNGPGHYVPDFEQNNRYPKPSFEGKNSRKNKKNVL